VDHPIYEEKNQVYQRSDGKYVDWNWSFDSDDNIIVDNSVGNYRWHFNICLNGETAMVEVLGTDRMSVKELWFPMFLLDCERSEIERLFDLSMAFDDQHRKVWGLEQDLRLKKKLRGDNWAFFSEEGRVRANTEITELESQIEELKSLPHPDLYLEELEAKYA